MPDLAIPTYDPATTIRSVEVTIDAPPEVVWDVLTDMDNYGDWNPFCLEARSTLEMGAPVDMVLADYTGNGGTSLNTEYVCAFVPNQLLSWELRATDDDPKAARRDQVLERLEGGKTLYYSTDAFLGVEAHQIMADSGAWVKRAFDETALALRTHCEKLAAEARVSQSD